VNVTWFLYVNTKKNWEGLGVAAFLVEGRRSIDIMLKDNAGTRTNGEKMTE